MGVVHESVVKPDGTTVTEISISLSNAPVPDRKYTAEYSSAKYRSGLIKIAFGQFEFIEQKLRSLLVIHLGPHHLGEFLDTLDKMSPSLDVLAEQNGVRPAIFAAITEEPAQTLAFSATYMLVAISGFETCMDLYQASAFALHHMRNSNQLMIDPVVRIDLPTASFLNLVTDLRDIRSQLSSNELAQ